MAAAAAESRKKFLGDIDDVGSTVAAADGGS
jgi:hypothetical protein